MPLWRFNHIPDNSPHRVYEASFHQAGYMNKVKVGESMASWGEHAEQMHSFEDGLTTRLSRRKFTFLLAFIIVAGLVTLTYILFPRIYRAEATVLVLSAEPVVGPLDDPANEQKIGDPADLESQIQILSSPQLIQELLAMDDIHRAILRECKDERMPIVDYAKSLFGPVLTCEEVLNSPSMAFQTLAKNLDVKQSGKSRVISVAYLSPFPEVAQLIVNSLSDTYISRRLAWKLEPRDAAIKWLHGHTDQLAQNLKTSEGLIAEYVHNHGLVHGQTAKIAAERLSELEKQRVEAEAELAAAVGRLEQTSLTRGASSEVRDVLTNRTISDLKQQLASVTSQIAKQSRSYGPSHPMMIGLQESQAYLTAAIEEEVRKLEASVRHDYLAARSRVATLTKQVEDLKLQVSSADKSEAEIAAAQQDVDVDRGLYADMSKKLAQLETERRLVSADVRVLSYADAPTRIFFPKLLTFGIVGFLLASASAAVAALYRDRADRSVRDAVTLALSAEGPVLARIPEVKASQSKKLLEAPRVEEPSAFQDAIRALFAECVLLNDHIERRTIIVASSESGEGKTFIALALARFAALTGRRVLAIDCDLRQPCFQTALSLPERPGLSEFLRQAAIETLPAVTLPGSPGLSDARHWDARPRELVSVTSINGLDVIAAGRPAVDSTELLSGPAMKFVLDWAAMNYDLIIVDTPPSRILKDARIIARNGDGVLYCARWGRSFLPSLVDGVRELRAAGGRVIGLVLNRVEESQYRLYDSSQPSAYTYLPVSAER